MSQNVTYFIDAVRGNNAFDGLTPETAKKTIGAANALALKPGDILAFHRDQTFSTAQLTLKTNNLTVTAYGPGNIKPTLVRTTSPAVGVSTGVKEGLTIDGLRFESRGIWVGSSSPIKDLTIKNCEFESVSGAIQINTARGIDNTGIVIENNTFNACNPNVYLVSVGGGRSQARIVGNTITNSNLGVTDGDRDGLSLQNMFNSLIAHNEISGLCDQYAGINLWSQLGIMCTGNIVEANFIHDVTGLGILHGGEADGTVNVTIRNNLILKVGGNAGIRLAREQKESLVFANTVCGCETGIFLSGLADNYTVKNNVLAGNAIALVNTGKPNNKVETNWYY